MRVPSLSSPVQRHLNVAAGSTKRESKGRRLSQMRQSRRLERAADVLRTVKGSHVLANPIKQPHHGDTLANVSTVCCLDSP